MIPGYLFDVISFVSFMSLASLMSFLIGGFHD